MATLLPFEAAARLGSFKKAAEELCLTQAAISRQIRALEENMGVALFERHYREVRLTRAGNTLAAAVTSGLEEIAGCTSRLRHQQGQREVVLFTELYVAMYWLVPRLAEFRSNHPDITIRLNASSQPLSRAEERFDLALQCTGRPSGLLQPILSVPDTVFPICSPALAAEASLDIEDLLALPLLHFREELQDNWMGWHEWFAALGKTPAIPEGNCFDSYPVMLQAVMAGQGIGLGWAGGLDELLANNTLVRPSRQRVHLPEGMSLYRARHIRDQTATRIVQAWLTAKLQAPPSVTQIDSH